MKRHWSSSLERYNLTQILHMLTHFVDMNMLLMKTLTRPKNAINELYQLMNATTMLGGVLATYVLSRKNSIRPLSCSKVLFKSIKDHLCFILTWAWSDITVTNRMKPYNGLKKLNQSIRRTHLTSFRKPTYSWLSKDKKRLFRCF